MSRGIDQLANISLLFLERRGPIMAVSLRIVHRLQGRNHIALRARLVKKSCNDTRFSFSLRFFSHCTPRRMRNDTARNSSGENRNGAALRRRNARGLFHRATLLQTGFQILGLCSPARTAMERIATRDVERETETRSRSRATRFRQRQ